MLLTVGDTLCWSGRREAPFAPDQVPTVMLLERALVELQRFELDKDCNLLRGTATWRVIFKPGTREKMIGSGCLLEPTPTR